MEIAKSVMLLHVILLIVATVFILRDRYSSSKQKKLQILFSFVLVIIGPAIAITVHWSDVMKPEKPSDRYMGQSIDESPYSWYWPFQ